MDTLNLIVKVCHRTVEINDFPSLLVIENSEDIVDEGRRINQLFIC